jgi:hypothetical protein
LCLEVKDTPTIKTNLDGSIQYIVLTTFLASSKIIQFDLVILYIVAHCGNSGSGANPAFANAFNNTFAAIFTTGLPYEYGSQYISV